MKEPSERMLEWLKDSGDPFWIGYAEFLEYSMFFKKIFDGFCGLEGRPGNSALMSFYKLQDYTEDDGLLTTMRMTTDKIILDWLHETAQAINKRNRQYNKLIRRALEKDKEYVDSLRYNSSYRLS